MSAKLLQRLRSLGYELAIAEETGNYCKDFKSKQDEHRRLLKQLYR